MSAGERGDLQKLARMNARVMKSDVDAVVADRLAEFERELQREWSAQELQVVDLLEEVNERVAAINTEIAQRCDEQGIRPELRPQMLSQLVTRTYLSRERVAEVRRLARAELDAAGKRAKVEVDRQTASLCGEVISCGLTSSEARGLLDRVQKVEQLVPALEVREIEARIGGAR